MQILRGSGGVLGIVIEIGVLFFVVIVIILFIYYVKTAI